MNISFSIYYVETALHLFIYSLTVVSSHVFIVFECKCTILYCTVLYLYICLQHICAMCDIYATQSSTSDVVVHCTHMWYALYSTQMFSAIHIISCYATQWWTRSSTILLLLLSTSFYVILITVPYTTL
jgi:hypothetical protein